MASAVQRSAFAAPAGSRTARRLPGQGFPWAAAALTGAALLFLAVFLLLPLVTVFVEALRQGVPRYLAALRAPDTLAAVRVTLIAASSAVLLNVVFGVAAAWLIARFDFRGKSVLLTIIDLPFAVSPIISGMIFALLFGRQGPLWPWLSAHGIKVLFAVPGIVLVTVFVTFPFIARELIPLMQAQGSAEEQAAVSLGASGWQTFWRVTVPNIRWGLLYGIILCNARAMGEFGAAWVVSGHIKGGTNTIPLHVAILYEEDVPAAFAVASMLALLALVTLILKTVLEWRFDKNGEN